MTISRRRFLAGATAALTAGCTNGNGGQLPAGGSPLPARAQEGQVGRLLTSARPPERFAVPLPKPTVLKPVSPDVYELTTKIAKVEILPGTTTEIWGYDGQFPGPIIESRSGRQVVVRTRNELPVPIVTHLHGGVTPPESDGYPTDLILPTSGWQGGHQHDGNQAEGERDYTYPLQQRAATLWYHDHRMDFTGPQVWRGLVGMQLVRDELDDNLPLPKGEREFALAILDRSFGEDGALLYPSVDPRLRERHGVTHEFHQGVLGDVILVNGAPWPYVEVDAARYRLRLLNASNARHYRLTLDPGNAPFVQVGSDQGLLGAPREHQAIDIAPAERFDVVVDFGAYQPGTNVVLRNDRGEGGTTEIMQFRVVRSARDDSTVPATLDPDFERLTRKSNEPDRKISFLRAQKDGGWEWRIERRTFSTDFIHADPALGSTELWQFVSDTEHPVHLHLAKFQVVQRLGGSAETYATDGGWKDTVRLEANKVTRVLVRFEGYKGKYVFHCHNLEHEDMGMMANFEVT